MRPVSCMNDQLEIGTYSTAGVRQENQDNIAHFETPFGYAILVADGMGGYEGGAIASQLVVSRFPALLAGLPETLAPEEALARATTALNSEIHARAAQSEAQAKMGSTLATLVVRQGKAGLLAIAGHVGDTRVYFCRSKQLFCLTRDHTLVQDLVASGALSKDQARNHPQSHILTRALGHTLALSIELSEWMLLRPGDTFLLCSDGLSGYVPDADIRDILLEQQDAPTLAKRLVELAMRQQSSDNVSAAVARVRDHSDDKAA